MVEAEALSPYTYHAPTVAVPIPSQYLDSLMEESNIGELTAG